MVEPSAPVEAPEPRYGRFTVTYPSGTVLDSVWCLEGGGTVQQVRLEHPLAAVEADLDSLVADTEAAEATP